MTPEEDAEIVAVERINTALPSLVESLNNDSRLPWVHGLTVESLEVNRVPPTVAAGNVFSSAAASIINEIVRQAKPVHAHLIGTRLVVIEATDEDRVLLAEFYFHDKKRETIGTATIEFDDSGAITDVTNAYLFKDGEPLTRRSGGYFQALLATLLLNSADDTEPASGMSCVKIGNVKLYRYKTQLLSLDSGYIDAPIKLSPRTLPRLRNDLAKELKNYGDPHPYKLSKENRAYFAEMGTSLEQSNEMWWVSEDMSKLAWDVALSGTEPEDLNEREIPTPAGIMWLNGGGGPVLTVKKFPNHQFLDTGKTGTEMISINAIIWYTPTKSIPGLELGKTRFMGLTASPEIVRDTTKWNGILSPLDLESNEMEFYRIPTYVTYHSLKFLPRKLALIVMRLAREETLGEKTSEIVGGSSSKKKARKRRIETVTCASLRRHRYLNDAEKEAESREYSHRWIVRGHMRNQPVGPRHTEGGQKHERVWIAPYVKGPEDKPLILKDRVQLFNSSGRSENPAP